VPGWREGLIYTCNTRIAPNETPNETPVAKVAGLEKTEMNLMS
jgi:hypothetical protein